MWCGSWYAVAGAIARRTIVNVTILSRGSVVTHSKVKGPQPVLAFSWYRGKRPLVGEGGSSFF